MLLAARFRSRAAPLHLGTTGWCRALAALMLSSGLLVIAPAHAQTKSALSWVRMQGAEGCIGTAELARRVERLVGPVLVSASRAQVSVEARVAPARRGFDATVVVADSSGRTLGRRTLHSASSDCRKLDESLVFVIAVAVDPDAALAELPSEFALESEPGRELLAELAAHPPRPHTTTSRSAAGKPREPRTPRPLVSRTPGLTVLGAAEPQLAIGLLPGVSLGLGAAFGLALGERSLWLHAGFWLPREQPGSGARRLSLGLSQLSLGLCPWALRADGWESTLCAGVTVALLSARPAGFAGRARDAWCAGPSLELRLRRRIASPLWVGLSLRGQSLWPRRSVGYELGPTDFHPVYRLPPAAAIVGASLELRF